MFLFGTHSALLKREASTATCPHCLNINSVDINVLQRYAHFFWIPFFPLAKTGLSICSHCKKVTRLQEMSDEQRSAFQETKRSTNTPVWTFAGLLLTLLTGGWVAYKINESERLYADMIAAPQKADMYTIKTEEKRYMLYKVSEVKGDTVFVFYSQTDAGKSKYTKEILKRGEHAFFKEATPLLKSDLLKMQADGKLLSVQRN